jgi:hypothetical protein
MSSPEVHLRWAKGGHAEIVRVDGDAIHVRSTTPAPPGARLEAALVGGATETPVKIKSHGSRREGEGEGAAFVLTGRLIDATRELRDRLASLAAP